jgi:hypothetical protein
MGLFLSVACLLTAQQLNTSTQLSGITENFLLVTDRSHYISGETIHFKAFRHGPSMKIPTDWSTVLYIELITSNGASLIRSKISLETWGGFGSVTIPTSISSGTYYLKAYTRWMRNCGPEAYCYTSVLVFDPFNEKVFPVDTTGQFTIDTDEGNSRPEPAQVEFLDLSVNRTSYHARERVDVDLNWNHSVTSAQICISVAKPEVQSNQVNFQSGCSLTGNSESIYIPEIQGVSLSGQSIARAGSLPVPYATIYVSILGEDRNFFCNYSDSAGRFYFSFPAYAGEKDLFVSTYHSEHDDLELLIDRDFSNEALHLPSYPVLLNDSMLKIVTELSVNAQVAQQYYPPQHAPKDEIIPDNRLFYGQPSASISFDDFIKLPRLEEYFIEVIPHVSVRRSRGVRSLQVLGDHPDLEIYQPLVMIDGVAIFDVEAVLAVSPRLIDRIEIIDAPYIRGNVTFGGIVSIISRNGDLGYIDLPSSGLLVNYQMLDYPIPDQGIVQPIDRRLPDVRNTLFWNPHVELTPGTNSQISFQTSDVKGNYQVLIRGYDSSGVYFEKSIPFAVD